MRSAKNKEALLPLDQMLDSGKELTPGDINQLLLHTTRSINIHID